jgi:aminopeptidase N
MKPALGYLYVKEMLGDQLFNKALKYYIGQWKGRHPTPFDFFACMNAGAGKDLNWFWYNWFFTKEVPDLAIGSVKHQQKNYTVNIIRNGNAIVPVHLNIIYTDGTKETVSRNISCWAAGNKPASLRFTARKQVQQLVLGAPFDADANKSNNTWKP